MITNITDTSHNTLPQTRKSPERTPTTPDLRDDTRKKFLNLFKRETSAKTTNKRNKPKSQPKVELSHSNKIIKYLKSRDQLKHQQHERIRRSRSPGTNQTD